MLDGAHNPQKLTAFTQAYDKLARPDTTWVVALLDGPKDKLESCVEIIMRQPGRIIVTEFNIEQGGKSRRSISVERFVKMAERYESDIVAEPDPLNALTLALERPGSSVVVTGSLYLVGIVRKRLGQLHGGRL